MSKEIIELVEAVGEEKWSAQIAEEAAPKRRLTNWIDAYVDYTADFEPPAMYALWSGLLTLSIATGHRVWLEEANIKIWPNLYVVLVGPSGIGKGQAMREALPFIQATGVQISPDSMTMAKLAVALAEATLPDEELGLITPYLLWAEELPSFLGMDAYKSGKLTDLTALYDCGDKWEKGTKTQGDDVIPNPFLCMLAGSTASGIFDVLPPASVGQGFTSRLMFVSARDYRAKRLAEKPWTPIHQELRERLLNDIKIIGKMRGGMKLSDTARVLWTDYYVNRALPNEEFNDERMQGYAARKPFYVKKIAMLLSLAERPFQTPIHDMLVREHHLERAMGMMKALDDSVRQTYSEISSSEITSHYGKVLKAINKKGSMSRGEIARQFGHTLPAKELTQVLGDLQSMELVEVEQTRSANNKIKFTFRVAEGKDVSEWL